MKAGKAVAARQSTLQFHSQIIVKLLRIGSLSNYVPTKNANVLTPL